MLFELDTFFYMRFIFILLYPLFVGLSANAQPLGNTNSLLRLHLVEDSTYRTVYSTQEMMYASEKLEQKRMENSLTAHFQFVVTQVLENQSFQLQFKITRIQSSQANGNQIFSYDSQKPGSANSYPKIMTEEFKAIIDKPIMLRVNSKGQIVNIKPAHLQMSGVKLKSIVQRIIHPLPDIAIQPGDSYQQVMHNPRIPNQDITLTYRVNSTDSAMVKLSISGALAQKESKSFDDAFRLQNNGTLILDKSSGWLHSYKGQSSLHGKSPTSGNYFLITNYTHYSIFTN